MQEIIENIFKESTKTKQESLKKLSNKIEEAIYLIIRAYNAGNKLLLCGNGGSAADAQHIAAEFIAKFYLFRTSLPAIALHTNTSTITAIGNDFSYKEIFSKQIQGIGNKGDILIAISTSGNSENIVMACKEAKNKGLSLIGFTGSTGGKIKDIVDILINVPSDNTPRIQEIHILIAHIICEIVEQKLFGNASI